MRLAFIFVTAALTIGSPASAQSEHDHSQHRQVPASPPSSRHVPPDPPSTLLEPMSHEQMHRMMEMDDSARFGRVVLDRLEWQQDDALAWEATAWYGGDRNKLLIKSERDSEGDIDRTRTEALWDRTVSAWWNLQTGVRVDSGFGPTRTWAAFGIEGLAPYWIDLETTFYAGDGGRTALRVEARHDLRLTQRLIVQSRLEANAYGKSDPELERDSGLSEFAAGLRLRYEIRREIAPYLGLQWSTHQGKTEDDEELRVVAGMRLSF